MPALARAGPRGVIGNQRQAEQRLQPRLGDALHRRGDMVHRLRGWSAAGRR